MKKFFRIILLGISGACFSTTLLLWPIGKGFVYINEKAEKFLKWAYYDYKE